MLLLATTVTFAQPSKDGFARERKQVTEGIWLIHRSVPTDAPFEGNSVVFEQTNGFVVVDAGGSPVAGEHLVRHIQALGTKPVKAVVITHYHGDHHLGLGAFLKVWPGLQIIATEQTRRNMTGVPMAYIKTYAASYAGMVDFGKQRLADPAAPESEKAGWRRFVEAGPSMVAGYSNLVVHPATVTFTDRLTLHDEKAPLEIRFLGRANTNGDAIIWAPRQRVMVTGDILVHPIPYASACFLGEWVGVLTQLEGYDFQYLVPGHGDVLTDRSYLERLRKALVDIRARVAPLVKQGMSLEEVRTKLDLSQLRRTFVADDDGWGRFVINAVFLGDLVKNAYQEAKGLPIVQGGE